MEIIDNTSAPNDTQLSANISHTGGRSRAPSYDIPEEDAHHAQAVLAINPLAGDMSPHVIPDGWRVPAFKLTALPPDRQKEVQERLATVPPEQRAQREAEFTAEIIQQMRPSLRALTGVGPQALPYHREGVALAAEARRLVQDATRLGKELEEIAGYRSEVNPATGQAEPKPVYRVQGPSRAAKERALHELIYRYTLLFNEDGTPGIEGARRMKQALYESVQLLKQRDEARAEMAEVERQAKEQVRNERIAAKVGARVRMARSAG